MRFDLISEYTNVYCLQLPAREAYEDDDLRALMAERQTVSRQAPGIAVGRFAGVFMLVFAGLTVGALLIGS